MSLESGAAVLGQSSRQPPAGVPPTTSAGDNVFRPASTLVERFIEFNQWPTSRKTFWLLAIALPLHIFFIPLVHIGLASARLVDLTLMDEIIAFGLAVIVIGLAVSWFAFRAGHEGRWTAYAVVLLYGAFLGVLIFELGIWSTAILAWTPCLIFLVAIWYDETIGWFAFVFSILVLVMLTLLTLLGMIPYAPAMIVRTLDAQTAYGWVVGVFSTGFAFYPYSFVLCVLVVGARKLQDARLQKAQRLISRYIPSQLAEEIIKGAHPEVFKPERAKLTFIFSDIEGFTEASDHLDPEDLAALLNEYLSEMMSIAEHYRATISQIVGDGIMMFFGAPHFTSDKDHAVRAVRMASDMQRRMVELKDAWVNRGIHKPFHIRIGINTGHASVGDYGSSGRKHYSAIGLQTNLAARIQAHCETGKILISHSTWALVRDEIACVDRGEVRVKGVHYPIKIYEVEKHIGAVVVS